MATKTRTRTSEAVTMLIEDHNKVKALFKQFDEAGDNAHKTKQRLAEQIICELQIHSKLEEQVFYPALCSATNKEGRELVNEGFEEHHVADLLMEELKSMDPSDPQFIAKVTVLCENIQHHIKEEEEEMFPEAETVLSDQMSTLADRMKALKLELTTAA